MSGHRSQRHTACCWLLRLAGGLVPSEVRAAWRRQRDASLESLCVLADRGELPGSDLAVLAWWCGDALASAFLLRCRGFDPRRWMRGPAFVMTAAGIALLLMAVCTHGFAATRLLLGSFGGVPSRQKDDRLVANLFPIVFAFAVSVMAAAGRVSLRGQSWRYYCFLLLKTLSLFVVASLLWIEGGPRIRAQIPNEAVRVLAGGLLLAVVFVGALGWAVIWSLTDQRQRCPACLHRLILPVRIGTCASVFEPPTTEWICAAGHGSLCVCEVGTGDRWIVHSS